MEMVPVPNAKPFSRHDQFDFPPGYRFCPFDHELILYYLKRKVNNQILPPNKIEEVNLYKYSPEELSEMYPTLGEKEWYFFTPRDRKYRNGQRPNRAAGRGYWKATGADKRIKHHGGAIGLRKALVYYEGKPPKGDKTNWIMHEYRVMGAPPPTREGVNDMRLDDWVLCRIYKKAEKLVKCARKTENFEPVTPPAHNNQDDHNFSVTNLQKEESIVTGVYREVMEEVRFPFLPREIMPHYSDIELMHDQFNQDYQNLNNLYDDTFNYSNMFVDQNSDDQMLL